MPLTDFSRLTTRVLLLATALGLNMLLLALVLNPSSSPGAQADLREIHLVDQTFKCSNYRQPINFDLVKVTITGGQGTRQDAVHTSGLGSECTGRIGRLEVDTWVADGVKVHDEAHDLVVEGGYVRCHAREGDVHQDGIQAMGGTRVTFRNLEVDCKTANNSAMFINQGAGGNGRPTDVVCVGCVLMKGATRNRVLRIGDSLRSGARNSTIVWCGTGDECGGGGAVYITDAIEPVNEGNTLVLHSEYSGTETPPSEPEPPADEPAEDDGSTTSPSEPEPSTSTPVLRVSTVETRTIANDLAGAELAGQVFVFAELPALVKDAVFYLNGNRVQREAIAPWDFKGGSVTAAKPWDTTHVPDGSHVISVRYTYETGERKTLTASVTVNNTGASASSTTSASSSTNGENDSAPSDAADEPDETVDSSALRVSTNENRSNAAPLQGAKLKGLVYVFAALPETAREVLFHLDGERVQHEGSAPWDFRGGTSTSAKPWDTTRVQNGAHEISVRITYESGERQTLTVTVQVQN